MYAVGNLFLLADPARYQHTKQSHANKDSFGYTIRKGIAYYSKYVFAAPSGLSIGRKWDAVIPIGERAQCSRPSSMCG